jgi:HNH endonuclease
MDETIRQLVRNRAGNRCEYCLLPQRYAVVVRFHIEHLRARQHGGDDAPANLALACPHCKRFKGPNLASFDPETDALVHAGASFSLVYAVKGRPAYVHLNGLAIVRLK